jgi:hypothetical protein
VENENAESAHDDFLSCAGAFLAGPRLFAAIALLEACPPCPSPEMIRASRF